MVKIQIGVPASQKEGLLQFLQEEEIVHMAPAGHDLRLGAVEKGTDTAYVLAQVQFALEFIGRVRSEVHDLPKRGFKNMFAGKPAATLQELEQTLAGLSLDTLLQDAHAMNDRLVEIKATMAALTERIAYVEPWISLSLSSDNLKTEAPIRHFLLTAVIKDESAFQAGLAHIPTALWQEAGRTAGKKFTRVHGELVVHVKDVQKAQQWISDIGAEIVTIQLAEGDSIADQIVSLKTEKDSLETAYNNLLDRARKMFGQEKDLRFAYDALLHKQERETASSQLLLMPHTAVLTGWMPSVWVEAFEKRLTKAFPASALEAAEPKEGEIPPVAFKNSKLIEPFEAVTNIYGKPAYHEIDPSGPLALFFLISFGLALTDAGYGLVMMASLWAAERFFRLKREMKKMVRLLFYAGFFTVILGALTGGWFGITLEELPPSMIRDALLSIKLVDPVSEPLTLLGAVFVLGIIQLLFAWVVKGYDKWRKGERAAVFLDEVLWISIVVFLLLWTAAGRGIALVPFANLLKWVVVANAVLLVLTQGRQQKNPLFKIGSGALSLYGLINFVSDTLSYSRLLALGLATGIIGLVVNLIAGMVSSSIPVVGVVMAVVVLLVGHVFNLGINALGAFIHSGRLQFVEFFPKFMEGGGVVFKPFGRVSRYVDNPKEFV